MVPAPSCGSQHYPPPRSAGDDYCQYSHPMHSNNCSSIPWDFAAPRLKSLPGIQYMGGCPTDDILRPGGHYIRDLHMADYPAAEACDKSLEAENDLPIARD